MYNLLSLLALVVFFTYGSLYKHGRRRQLELPRLGFDSVWISYINSVRNFIAAKKGVHEQCRKFGNRPFTFPMVGQWFVMVKGKECTRAFCNASEGVLSMEHAVDELLQLRHAVGDAFVDETYHIRAIRSELNLNLAKKMPDLLSEMVVAFAEELDARLDACEDRWSSVKASAIFPRIVCRASNRVFVGLPLCRNEEYIRLSLGFSTQILRGGTLIRLLLPQILRRVGGYVFRGIYGHHSRMTRLIRPLVERRMKQRAGITPQDDEGNNDMVTWLMNTAEPEQEHTLESLAMRMLNVNFVALHTTTKTFTHALYTLASDPSYAPILREEAQIHLGDTRVSEWTKEMLGRCVKLDSFLRETLRFHGLATAGMPRYTETDFTFPDGTRIPPGNLIAIALTAIHEDQDNYDNPETFDGLRFVKRGGNFDTARDGQWTNRLTSTSTSFLAFGGGRHICPGRYFAALEMKCFVAYLIMNYDVRMKDGLRPKDEWIGPTAEPAQNASVMIRRRLGRSP